MDRLTKPIIFNSEMVRAIHDGRKTMTRRVLRRKGYDHKIHDTGRNAAKHGFDNLWQIGYGTESIYPQDYIGVFAPYQPGDILWVRESFCPSYFDDGSPAYKADYDREKIGDTVPEPKWKPSIHMPREAARLFLRVTDVWAERLQEISMRDVIKEGIAMFPADSKKSELDDRFYFIKLWDSLYAKRGFGWDTNPWVWVIEFERMEKPAGGAE
jgi:hypothetical protein